MRLFGAMYARALVWARHPQSIYYLCGLSFVEAFIFPVMPEVMLAPMMQKKKETKKRKKKKKSREKK